MNEEVEIGVTGTRILAEAEEDFGKLLSIL
jgi:hypothetical protein